jgi:hypothetical protein
MIPDPATTPLKAWRQVLFGLGVATVCGIIQVLHLVFGLFFALLIVCAIRGISLHLHHASKSSESSRDEITALPVLVPQGAPPQ